jgi:hypothetical protein
MTARRTIEAANREIATTNYIFPRAFVFTGVIGQPRATE